VTETPPQPPAAQPGQAQIVVTTKFLWLAWFFFFIKPKISINGYEVPAMWGRNVVPMPPGQHHVHVHVPYFLPPKVGPADMTVTAEADQVVDLEYRAPLWTFSRGSLGPPPQKYNGVWINVAILVAALLIICLCCGGAILAEAAA
jgi:hypothetical protein